MYEDDLVCTYMSEELYKKEVVDDSGKNVNNKPYFIYWPRASLYEHGFPSAPLQTLARHFEGKIAFRFADYYADENLRMSYEIYQGGKAFYIDEEGKAYIYPGAISVNATRDWIESRKYRMSPF